MPNTLAHIGFQVTGSRLLIRAVDPKWVFLGCVLPDVPWIVQRLVVAATQIDVIGLRYYFDVQASLAGTLVLSAAIAFLSRFPRRVFAVLSLNAGLHLLLDAAEKRFGNGAHLFAPFSWDLTNWGLFMPDSFLDLGLTGLGVFIVVRHCLKGVDRPCEPIAGSRVKPVWSLVLVSLYFAAPLALADGPRKHDNHFLVTISDAEARSGAFVEFDRASFLARPGGGRLRIGPSDEVSLSGLDLSHDATVSLRGHFLSARELAVTESHVHLPLFRDVTSILGLAAVALVWLARMHKHWFGCRSFLTVGGAAERHTG